MRVFVTGGTGFVGAHTVTALLEAGHEVLVLARNPSAVKVYFEPRGSRETNVTFLVDHLSFCAAGTNSQEILAQRFSSNMNSILATFD